MAAREPKPRWSGWTKFIGLMMAGGITGYVAATFGMTLLDEGGVLSFLSGAELAFGTALLYLLMGAMVGFGTLAPRAGAAILNVEDADEIVEEKASMAASAVGCILMAVIIGVVAVGSPEVGIIAPAVAGIAALALSVAAAIPSWQIWKNADELMRDVMRDAGATSYYILFGILGVWTGAAQLGFIAGPKPLDIFAMLFAAPLLAAFLAVGRRGMMRPRG